MRLRTLFLGMVCLLVCFSLFSSIRGESTVYGRPHILLDGTWDFAPDPENAGETEKWYLPETQFPDMPRPGYAPSANGNIEVPGCWDNQGYGTETEKLKHSFVGKGWYEKKVAVPAKWNGKSIRLVIGGVHRSAKVWINGRFAGDHIGYLSEFELDVTSLLRAGKTNTITIQVDSKQDWSRDTLTGCADLIDYMHIEWGGIWGHVHLEARRDAWLEDVFVQTKIDPHAVLLSASVAGDRSFCDSAELVVTDAAGTQVAKRRFSLPESLNKDGLLELSCKVPEAELWSPDHPALYYAEVQLIKGDKLIDTQRRRFGIREIAIRGPSFYLNGKKIFLRGYGDDHIYPQHMALPLDKELYKRRLRRIISYGFNHVRHHSAIMPPEYYEACDEEGMLVSAEFPIAYQNFYNRAKGAAVETYKKEWAAAIVRLRNHPSIFDWCMGNELWNGVPLAETFQAIARRLDPTRPFIDSDGLWPGYGRGTEDRPTLDFYMTLFGGGEQNLPLDDRAKYAFARPGKPVISHETGNFVTFPRLDQITLFKNNIKPFWLTPVRERLTQNGLLKEAGLWARNSEKLYLLCHKINTEAIRRNPYLSGYHWWLFQDYWTTSNGLVDTYFRPKSISPDDVLPFNNDVVLLLDGVELAYRAGEELKGKILVSNFSADDLKDGTLTLSIKRGTNVLTRKQITTLQSKQGSLEEVITFSLKTLLVEKPARITIEADLEEGNRSYHNHWHTWVIPGETKSLPSGTTLYVDGNYRKQLSDLKPRPLPNGASYTTDAVYVTETIDSRLCTAIEKGARVVLLQNQWILPTSPTRFKTAWWHGSERDTNCGTVVYDNSITASLAPEGWCEAVWYPLLEGAKGYLLTDPFDRVDVLVRGIEVLHLARNKALLFQARIGKGILIASGLNHKNAADTPQGEWLLKQLVQYAAGSPEVTSELSVSCLRDKVMELPQPPYLLGFEKVLEKGEVAPWHTYREDDVPTYACRQTQPGLIVSWETAKVPETMKETHITFVFAGGLGWVSEPATRGFVLLLNGKEGLNFDVSMQPKTWKSPDGNITLYFMPKRLLPLDAVGLFYVTVNRHLVTPDRPCTFSVRSLGSGSRRWFALHPYCDVLKEGR